MNKSPAEKYKIDPTLDVSKLIVDTKVGSADSNDGPATNNGQSAVSNPTNANDNKQVSFYSVSLN